MIPTLFGLKNKNIYIHGSVASRLLKSIDQGINLCFTVSLIDGLVLARSGFHHSINYRSVVLFGKGILVVGEEKLEALKVISDQSIPHRWDEVRPPNEKEMKATTIIKLQVDEGSAKIRTGSPIDDEEDYDLDVWAGVVPMRNVFGEPIPDERLKQGVSISPSVRRLLKSKKSSD